MNLDIWVVGTSNQLFTEDSEFGMKFSKKLSSYWENSEVIYGSKTFKVMKG